MSKNNMLEEEARKRRTYNAQPKECPVVSEWKSYKPYGDKCQHVEIIKKHLFTTSYNICKSCGEEVNV